VDFVAVFPTDYIIRLLQWHQGAEARSFRMLRLARLLRYARLLKLLNFKRLDDVQKHVQDQIGWNAMSLEFLWKVTMLCLVFVAFNHMGGLMFIFIGRENSALIEPYGPGGGYWDAEYSESVISGQGVSAMAQYVDAIYFVMMTLTSVGYGDIVPKLQSERLFVYILMMSTAFLYANVIGTFADLISNKRRDKNAFESKMRSVFAFLDLVECPKGTQDKVRSFYQYRYPNRTLFNEHSIFQELPNKVKNEVVLHRFERTIHNVPFFRSCSDDIIVDICLRLRGHTASPADVIVAIDEESSDLTIMDRGCATGYDGSITMTFEAGSFFGELQFLGISKRATMRIVADEFCEFYTLRYQHIRDLLEAQADLHARLVEYSKLRKQALDGLKSDDSSVVESTSALDEDVHEQHHDVIDIASRVAKCPRNSLEALIIDAVGDGKLEADDLDL